MLDHISADDYRMVYLSHISRKLGTMEWESVLDYEEQCYEEGFAKGTARAEEHFNDAGYYSGIKIGFEKFLALGIMQGRVESWSHEGSMDPEKISAFEQQTEVQNYNNTPEDVERLDRQRKLATNRVKLAAIKTKTPRLNLHDDITAVVKSSAEKHTDSDMF